MAANPDLLAGKYELVERIGSGGMAEVWLAVYHGIEGITKLVAVKRIREQIAADENFVRMFLDEAKTAADLRHPNIIDIIDVGEHDDTYYLAMAYLPGRDLRAVWRRAATKRIALPWGLTIFMIIEAARGLHYAHTKTNLQGEPLNIVHRDVSPQNILITRHGITKVLDFGIARATHKSTFTRPGAVRGKAEYMSPEQATGQDIDARSDQFSLGILLYELTTGRRLYKREGDRKTMEAVVSDPVPQPSLFMDYAEDLEYILRRTLAKRPENRFASCGDLADALEEFLRQERIRQSPRRVAEMLRSLFGDELDVNVELQDHKVEEPEPPVEPPEPDDFIDPMDLSSGQIFVGHIREFLASSDSEEPDDG